MVETAQESGTPVVRNKRAPIVAFSTFEKALFELRRSGIPDKLEHADFYRFSEQVQEQLMAAFRFADLINTDDLPTEKLLRLVEAAETPDWQAQLADFLRATFPNIFELNLADIGHEMFFARFAETYRGRGVSLRKAIAFFVHAVREAGIPTHPDFGRRRSRTRRAVILPKSDELLTCTDPPRASDRKPKLASAYEVLMYDIFDPTTMPPGSEEERAVFTLARHIRIRGP